MNRILVRSLTLLHKVKQPYLSTTKLQLSTMKLSPDLPSTKVIIDTDPGIDDMECMTMLLKHTDVLALTTTFGNCTIDRATNNACRILSYLERCEVPVYKGAARPLTSSTVWGSSAGFVHGDDGMGNTDLVPRVVLKTEESESAPNALIRLVNANPGEITLVAIGPLTNLAIAANLEPDIVTKLKAVYIMGGSYNTGNVTKYAEWNFSCDPLAADLVLKAYGRDNLINLVTWDCCQANGLHVSRYIEGLELENCVTDEGGIDVSTPVVKVDKARSKSAELMRTIAVTYPWCLRGAKRAGNFIFADQLIALLILCPEACVRSERGDCSVVLEGEQRGQTLVKWGSEGSVNIYKELDMERLVELYKATIA